jgi:hypothetical protein
MFDAIYFSTLYVSRPRGEAPNLAPCVAALVGAEGRRQPLGDPPRPRTASSVVCNMTGAMCFDGDVDQQLVPGLEPQPLPMPWDARSLSTIFGNVSFRARSPEAMFLGVRQPNHLLALARVLCRGNLCGITLHRFDVDAGLGRHVQVAHGCFLEVVAAAVFRGLVEPVPRTEEISNAVLLHFPDVGTLLRAAAAKGLAPPPPAELDGALWADARGAAQITRVGHVKLRLNWPDPPSVEPGALEEARRAVVLVCDHLVAVLRALS